MPFRPRSSRRVSLGTKLALVTSLVLVAVSFAAFTEIAANERVTLVTAKTTAARMVTQLLAIELGPTVDFGDDDDLASRLAVLHAYPDIVAVAVWRREGAAPSSSWAAPDAVPLALLPTGETEDAVVSPDGVVVTRRLTGRLGGPIAWLKVAFTLRPENEALARSRVRLLWLTGLLTAATATLLIFLARRYVLTPLRRMADAARALARGDLSARVDVRSNDEIRDLALSFNSMGEAVAFRQERMQRELDLAQRIQTSILPRTLELSGLELAASMTVVAEIGGDYYDVIGSDDGGWIGIGDVAGHGLDTGLIMLMTQAVVSALVRREPRAAPRDVVCLLNEVLFDNIRNRLCREDHVTFALLRYERSGRVTFAGAHEDIIVYRVGSRRCEVVPTPGTWLGGRRDITHAIVDSVLDLDEGDVIVLYTDGLVELRDAAGEEFGVERLCEAIEAVSREPVAAIQAHLRETLAKWGTASDDMTFLVARYRRPEAIAA